jgi:hypothetical protein
LGICGNFLCGGTGVEGLGMACGGWLACHSQWWWPRTCCMARGCQAPGDPHLLGAPPPLLGCTARRAPITSGHQRWTFTPASSLLPMPSCLRCCPPSRCRLPAASSRAAEIGLSQRTPIECIDRVAHGPGRWLLVHDNVRPPEEWCRYKLRLLLARKASPTAIATLDRRKLPLRCRICGQEMPDAHWPHGQSIRTITPAR